MNRATDSSPPLTALGRLRYWWQRLAEKLPYAHGKTATGREHSQLVAQLRELLEGSARNAAANFQRAPAPSRSRRSTAPPTPRSARPS